MSSEDLIDLVFNPGRLDKGLKAEQERIDEKHLESLAATIAAGMIGSHRGGYDTPEGLNRLQVAASSVELAHLIVHENRKDNDER